MESLKSIAGILLLSTKSLIVSRTPRYSRSATGVINLSSNGQHSRPRTMVLAMSLRPVILVRSLSQFIIASPVRLFMPVELIRPTCAPECSSRVAMLTFRVMIAENRVAPQLRDLVQPVSAKQEIASLRFSIILAIRPY